MASKYSLSVSFENMLFNFKCVCVLVLRNSIKCAENQEIY